MVGRRAESDGSYLRTLRATEQKRRPWCAPTSTRDPVHPSRTTLPLHPSSPPSVLRFSPTLKCLVVHIPNVGTRSAVPRTICVRASPMHGSDLSRLSLSGTVSGSCRLSPSLNGSL